VAAPLPICVPSSPIVTSSALPAGARHLALQHVALEIKVIGVVADVERRAHRLRDDRKKCTERTCGADRRLRPPIRAQAEVLGDLADRFGRFAPALLLLEMTAFCSAWRAVHPDQVPS
jgi:hypothetical protein